MTEAEAALRAQELNMQLGAEQADGHYIEVERRPGEWAVEKRIERKSWLERLSDAFLDALP